MARENEYYRPVLETMLEIFGKRTISIDEAAEYRSCHRDTLIEDKTFPKGKNGNRWVVDLTKFAMWVSHN